MSKHNASALEAELTEMLSEIKSAAAILRRLEKMGVLTAPDGREDKLCYRRWRKNRHGEWSGYWVLFAEIESR